MTEVVTIKNSILTSANYLLIDLKQYLAFFIIGGNMGDFIGKVTVITEGMRWSGLGNTKVVDLGDYWLILCQHR
jgi:hypothetical protein